MASGLGLFSQQALQHERIGWPRPNPSERFSAQGLLTPPNLQITSEGSRLLLPDNQLRCLVERGLCRARVRYWHLQLTRASLQTPQTSH